MGRSSGITSIGFRYGIEVMGLIGHVLDSFFVLSLQMIEESELGDFRKDLMVLPYVSRIVSCRHF
jgi:hypothetical protein